MNIWMTLLLLLLSLPLLGQSQAPFRGGPGDGYARATISQPVSVEDAWLAQVQLQRNSVQAGMPLQIRVPAGSQARLALFSLTGQRLLQLHTSPGPASEYFLPTTQLSPGIYLLQVSAGAQRRSWRIQIFP